MTFGENISKSDLYGQSMTTPERSVEEIVEEYCTLHCHTVQGVPIHSTQTAVGEIDWLRETLQAERQKRYEALEEAGNYVDELYQSGNMGKNEYELLTDFFDKKLTQPNNPN